MRIIVHEPTVEAPEEAGRAAATVLEALAAELRDLADGAPSSSSDSYGAGESIR